MNIEFQNLLEHFIFALLSKTWVLRIFFPEIWCKLTFIFLTTTSVFFFRSAIARQLNEIDNEYHEESLTSNTGISKTGISKTGISNRDLKNGYPHNHAPYTHTPGNEFREGSKLIRDSRSQDSRSPYSRLTTFTRIL
jgi:hypothetical protein